MSDIDLEARREELSLIILEGRARITAVIQEGDKRRRGRKPKDFESSINIDETATEAINAINNRDKRLSKLEKVKKSLMEMGISEAEADKMISARNIRDHRNHAAISNPFEAKSDKTSETSETSSKGISNPFEK